MLFSDAWKEGDSAKLEEEGMVDLGKSGIRETIGSPGELVSELRGSINDSLGEYSKWTTTGLMHAVRDPMSFAERQRTMAHAYFRNPDDQLVKDNLLGLIAERESQRAILDAAEKATVLARVEEIAKEEGASSATIGARLKDVGDMLDAYAKESADTFSPKARTEGLKKYGGPMIKNKPGWFFVPDNRNSMRYQFDDYENVSMFNHMPIGVALEKAKKHGFEDKSDAGVKQHVLPIPFQTMIHMVVADAFVDGLRIAKIRELTQPKAERAAAAAPIGHKMPRNYDSDDEEMGYSDDEEMYSATIGCAERAARGGMPVGNVFADAVDKMKGVIPWGKKSKSEDDASLDAALNKALGGATQPVGDKKANDAVLCIATSGPTSIVRVAPFDDAMKADLASDRAASAIGAKFSLHAFNVFKKNHGVDATQATFDPAKGCMEVKDGSIAPFSVQPGEHIGAALVGKDGITHNYDVSMYGYRLKKAGAPTEVHEVSLVHLRPKQEGDSSRTMIMETAQPAIAGAYLKDSIFRMPAISVTFPKASDPAKAKATGRGYGAEHAVSSANYRSSLKIIHFN